MWQLFSRQFGSSKEFFSIYVYIYVYIILSLIITQVCSSRVPHQNLQEPRVTVAVWLSAIVVRHQTEVLLVLKRKRKPMMRNWQSMCSICIDLFFFVQVTLKHIFFPMRKHAFIILLMRLPYLDFHWKWIYPVFLGSFCVCVFVRARVFRLGCAKAFLKT